MKYKIFVDGQEGTTGLEINERLEKIKNIEVLKIDKDKRKDQEEKRKYLNSADLVFLCLPDAASKESVSLIENQNTKVIDASTAFRTDDNWVYGLPELSKEQRELIKNSKRVANPGCHATGFITAMYPLVSLGIVPKDYSTVCYSLTGYSGGGKKLIQRYNENIFDKNDLNSPQLYALGLTHKHLPEMKKICSLMYEPLFSPILGNFYRGMAVSIPLLKRDLNKKVSAKELHGILSDYYKEERFVKVMPFGGEEYLDNGFLDPTGCNNTNNLQVFVFGNEEQIIVTSRLDNLGKGASGAAVQNMNIMLGMNEEEGLI